MSCTTKVIWLIIINSKVKYQLQIEARNLMDTQQF